MKQVKILAIESSCDETAAAVIGMENDKPVILSNVVSSQIDLHAKTGGVVPEVASRAHVEAILPVITEALPQASESEERLSVTKPVSSRGYVKRQTLDETGFVTVTAKRSLEYLRSNITHVAVTAGPGLIGSLLVGFNAAKSIAYALNKPIIPVNHIEGHIASAMAEEILNPKSCLPAGMAEILNKDQNPKVKYQIRDLRFPVLALVVSGGHTSLILMKDHGDYEVIGETQDDAAGEAFDKVAKLLGLGYPGGPAISKLASQFRKYQVSGIKYQAYNTHDTRYKIHDTGLVFPRPMINDGTFNFSFSGLKTAVLTEVKKRLAAGSRQLAEIEKAEIAAAFEDAAVDVLVAKTMRAVEKHQPKTLVLAGGVAANKHLREIVTSDVRRQTLIYWFRQQSYAAITRPWSA